MHKQKIKAFTLVELIVVITILAILGTIAFISLSGYSEDARDSTRVSDLSAIKTSLELFELDAGKYPNPTNGTNITYSGAIVWNQGTIGETVHANLSKLDKIPKDPLTDKEYTYSVISNGNEYELGGMTEGDIVALERYEQAQAGTVEAQAYTTGNYNGMMTKTLSGVTCSIFSLPSIITNDISVTDLQQLVTEQRLVYRSYKNLPSSLKESKFKNDGGFAFVPNKLVSYSDTGSCAKITENTASGTSARVTLLKGLQDSYTGTIVQSDPEIKRVVDVVIDENNPSNDVVKLVGDLVNNNLGGNVGTSSSSSSSSSTTSSTGGGSSSGGGYPGCDSPDIVLGAYTISACNIGAAVSGTGVSSYGQYFQWGRNKGFAYNDVSQEASTIAGSVGLNAGTDTYGFVWYGSLPSTYTWANSDISDNWGEVTNTSVARKGPCATGYHVPSIAEWGGLHTAGGWGNDGNAIMNDLKLPKAGYRDGFGGYFDSVNSLGRYWSSSPSGVYGAELTFHQSWIYQSNNWYRAQGYPIRCFKN